MIARDRELLARLGQVNSHLGEAVVALVQDQDGGELPAEGVRVLAELLGSMSAALYARAAELTGRVVEPPARVIIDAEATEIG